jgi:MFS family permease
VRHTTDTHRSGGQDEVERSPALALTWLASFMVVLDMLVVATALSFAVLLMTAAAVGDRFGRRRVFAIGLAVFAVASAACALSPTVGWLIAARMVQGSVPPQSCRSRWHC